MTGLLLAAILATAAAALMVGIVVSAALGITAGPLADLLGIAASNVGLP